MKFAFRSPKLFKHGGLYLKVWGKWYRIYKVEDGRLERDWE